MIAAKGLCPCCGQGVSAMTLEMIVEARQVSELQARILRAVWAGKGRTVPTSKIFDAMYADDPDGGPGFEKMYNEFKFALHRLREKLRGTGVGIENVGYRKGWRIVVMER